MPSRPFFRSPDTMAHKLARLATRLANTRDEQLLELTVDEVVHETGAPRKDVQYQLIIAQQKARARLGR